MKQLLIQILFAVLFTNSVLATEPETGMIKPLNRLNINFQTNFFITNKDYNHNDDDFFPLFNPGIEFLYERQLNEKISFLTGANYVYSTWSNSIGVKFHYKRLAHELFIPVLFNIKLHDEIYITMGVYPGWLVKGKQLYKDEMGYRNWIDDTEQSNYASNQKFSADIFLGAGFTQPLKNKQSIQFVPFVKYKIADNWMGEVRCKVSFGIRINYSFKI